MILGYHYYLADSVQSPKRIIIMTTRPFAPLLFTGLLAITCQIAIAEVGHDHPKHHDPHAHHSHADPLHFLHPLVTESPLPENEARLEFSFANLAGGEGEEFTLTTTVGIAPVRWFGIEFSAPLTHLNPDAGSSETRLGDLGVGFKFACFAFEEHGLLLSVGLELGLPTGNEERGIGNDHVLELEPWVGIGYKRDRFEWIARIGVGFPTNQNGEREADSELEWATSFLLHLIDHRLAALIEIDGLRVFGEEEDGFDSIAITPGIRFFPFDNPDIGLGIGVRLPLTNDRDSHVQMLLTLFFHF